MTDKRKPALGGFSFITLKTVLVFRCFSRSGWSRLLNSGFVRFGLCFGSFGVFFRSFVHFILSFAHFFLSLLSMLVSILSFVLGFFIASSETEGSGQHQGNS